MSQYILSILIPTVVGREESLERLLEELYRQKVELLLPNIVQFQFKKDDKKMSVGLKRHLLYQESIGEYSVMWDDDDGIHPNGLSLMINALKSKPDCLGYEEKCLINGIEQRSNISMEYADWEGDGNSILYDGFHYHRTNFFKTPIRTDLCRQVGVEDCRFGEDHIFARAIKPLLKTQEYIPEQIYHYIHESSEFNERYGFNK